MAPVQLLVLGYDQPAFSGDALREARRLEEAGVLRVVDVAEADAHDVEEDTAANSWSLADVVRPGKTAVVVLLEHLWASGLVGAIAAAGGRPLDEMWLAADERQRLQQLEAVKES